MEFTELKIQKQKQTKKSKNSLKETRPPEKELTTWEIRKKLHTSMER